MNIFFILLLYFSKCSSGNTDVVTHNHLKIVQDGDTVNFACNFPKESRNTVVWVKQKPGEKPLSIVSSYQALDEVFHNGFDKQNRFFVAKDDRSFNLSITNLKESDTATYYCIIFLYQFIFSEGTDLIVKGRELNTPSDHERAVIDPVHPEDSLQCTVLTQSCAGQHNVYWFRRESDQSPPGIIFTQQRRSARCERSSEVSSTAHKCIYSLPKTNLSLSDAGIYYCAVTACGQILFGDARKPDLPRQETPWSTFAVVLASSNCLSVIVIIFLCAQLHKHQTNDRVPYVVLDESVADVTTTVNYKICYKHL